MVMVGGATIAVGWCLLTGLQRTTDASDCRPSLSLCLSATKKRCEIIPLILSHKVFIIIFHHKT